MSKILTPNAGKTPPFHCPECSTPHPPYGFHLARHDLGLIGVVEYFTVFCAAPRSNPTLTVAGKEVPIDHAADPGICGCILAVNVMSYVPPSDPELMRQLIAAMTGAKGGPQ